MESKEFNKKRTKIIIDIYCLLALIIGTILASQNNIIIRYLGGALVLIAFIRRLFCFRHTNTTNSPPLSSTIKYSISIPNFTSENINQKLVSGLIQIKDTQFFNIPELKHDTAVKTFYKNVPSARFIPHKGIISDPETFKFVVHKIIEVIKKEVIEYDTLCALSESGNCLVSLIKAIEEKYSLRCDQKPKTPSPSGSNMFLPRDPSSGERLLLIDTVIQTGTAIANCKEYTEGRGAKILKTICVIHNDLLDNVQRDTFLDNGTSDRIGKQKKEIIYLYKMSDLINKWVHTKDIYNDIEQKKIVKTE